MFALSFLVGPAVGAVLAGLIFAVLTCDHLSECIEYFMWGIALFGVFGLGGGLVVGPVLAYWYFLVRPYRERR